MEKMYMIGAFICWTFTLYWSHRLAHTIPLLKKLHMAHHSTITDGKGQGKWCWGNLFFYQDNLQSTIEVCVFELLPTILFCYITQQWWILLWYYIWSAFLQEVLEHNTHINIYPFLTSGKWHLIHHEKEMFNYGLFTPFWDVVFNTNTKPNR